MTIALRRLGIGQLVADGLLAILVLAGFAGLGPDSVAGGWIAALLFAAATAVRRLQPWLMVVLATTAGGLQLVAASANVGTVMVLALLFATAGADRSSRVRLAGLIAAVVAAVGGGIASGTHGLFGLRETPDGGEVLLAGVQIAVVAGAAWLVGLVRHQRRVAAESHVAARIAQVELVHEQERTRIARDMHDVVAHALAVVVAQAEGARYSLATRPELAEEALRTIADTSRGSLDDVRRLLGELRGEPSAPAAPGDEGLIVRMRQAGLDLDVTDLGTPRILAAATAMALHRILTEALTNALRHGEVTKPVTLVRRWSDDEVEVTVGNAVCPGQPAGWGHGLTGIAERAALVGGSVEHGTTEEGFVLRVRLPYRAVTSDDVEREERA